MLDLNYIKQIKMGLPSITKQDLIVRINNLEERLAAAELALGITPNPCPIPTIFFEHDPDYQQQLLDLPNSGNVKTTYPVIMDKLSERFRLHHETLNSEGLFMIQSPENKLVVIIDGNLSVSFSELGWLFNDKKITNLKIVDELNSILFELLDCFPIYKENI